MSDYLVDGTPVDEWQDCLIADCSYKRCARLDSEYCYAHSNSPSNFIVKELENPIKETV